MRDSGDNRYARRVLFFLVLVAASFLSARCAHATTTHAQAWVGCLGEKAADDAAEHGGQNYSSSCFDYLLGGTQTVVMLNLFDGATIIYYHPYSYDVECESGATWNATTHECSGGSNACTDAPDLHGTIDFTTDPGSGNLCISGCTYIQISGGGGRNSNGNGHYGRVGTFKRPEAFMTPGDSAGTTCTGTTTAYTPAGSDPNADICIPNGSLTQCQTADGKLCAQSSRGTNYCWTPGETGTKAAPDQKESLALTSGPTGPAAPPGLTNAETVPVTQSSNDGTTATTVVNNLTLANTTGVPSTGTGGPGEHDYTGILNSIKANTDKIHEHTSTGGTTCASAPSSTGDEILGQVALQAWKTRCNAESLTDETNGLPKGAGNDGDDTTPDPSSVWHTPSTPSLNDTGLGFSRDVPVLKLRIGGVDHVLPHQDLFGDLISVLRWLFFSITVLWCIQILRG